MWRMHQSIELDQPENTITVTTEDGETTVIQLGMENDSTSQEYIDLNKDSSTVYVVSNSTFSSFEGTLYDFAKSGVFPTVDSSTVSKISVDGKDSSYVVEKDENNFWNITGDGETEKADSAKATSLASTLSSVAYASYVNYNCAEDELSQYGLDKPYAEITVDYQEEVEKESTDDENEAENGDEEVSEASGDENQADENADSETDGSESLDEDADSETDGSESPDEDEDSETDGYESSDEDVDVADTEDSEAVENENTDETADDNVEAEDTDVTESDDEAGVETTDTESAESSEDSEPETEMVDRELVIQVGDQSSDGGRYVRVNDSNEIYTISEDSLDTFLGKTNADFWDLTVSYLSANNLDTLDVNYGGEDYIVNVSRETSFFTIFGLRRSVRSDLLFRLSENHSHFSPLLIFKIIVFSILFLIFSVFSIFFLYFRVFHVVFRLCFLSFIKLFNYIFIFSYELNFYIRFFGFSKPFTKRILGPFFHGFLPIWKDFIP